MMAWEGAVERGESLGGACTIWHYSDGAEGGANKDRFAKALWAAFFPAGPAERLPCRGDGGCLVPYWYEIPLTMVALHLWSTL